MPFIEIAESQVVQAWWDCYDVDGRCRFCAVVVPMDAPAVYAVDANYHQPRALHAKSHGVG